MINAIKSEVRKLLTVRSTYVIMLLALALVTLMAFYVEGYWGKSGSPAGSLAPTAVNEILVNTAGLAALFISIVSVLQVGHEFRYGTIAYTLTANSRRTKAFFAKGLVLTVFAIIFGMIVAAYSVISYKIGVSLRGASLPPQDLNLSLLLAKIVLYAIVYGLFGYFLTVIVKNIIVAIAVLLILPSTVEPLLSILLKDNAKYLPMSTFDAILGAETGRVGQASGPAMILSVVYILVIGLIAWSLFLKRDAN